MLVNFRKGVPPPPQAAKPTASPPGGSYREPPTATIPSSTPDAEIWYTLDGTMPVPGGTESRLYTSPIPVSGSAELRAMVSVFTNLGNFVESVGLEVTAADPARLDPGGLSGSRRARLMWNGRTRDGTRAGTGAYIFQWNVTFFPINDPPVRKQGRGTFGLMRMNRPRG